MADLLHIRGVKGEHCPAVCNTQSIVNDHDGHILTGYWLGESTALEPDIAICSTVNSSYQGLSVSAGQWSQPLTTAIEWEFSTNFHNFADYHQSNTCKLLKGN